AGPTVVALIGRVCPRTSESGATWLECQPRLDRAVAWREIRSSVASTVNVTPAREVPSPRVRPKSASPFHGTSPPLRRRTHAPPRGARRLDATFRERDGNGP